MNLRLGVAILAGKLIAAGSRLFNIGAGSTWSGEVALRIEPRLIRKMVEEFWPRSKAGLECGIVLVAGTNGKTTTVKMIRTLFEDDSLKKKTNIFAGGSSSFEIFSNEAGANLLNGIAGALIKKISLIRPMRSIRLMGVFEIDEATLPLILREFTPRVVVILNLFRDQLDRYGEVNATAAKWHQALQRLPQEVTVILNADDPRVAYLGEKLRAKVRYFGFEDLGGEPRRGSTSVRADSWGDSLYCPRCGQRLIFEKIYFSHLGDWRCEKCGLKRPKLDFPAEKVGTPLFGRFNLYNGAAAILALREFGEFKEFGELREFFKGFRAAFGRGEEIRFKVQGSRFKAIKILLAKNPTGLNENIRLVCEDDSLRDFPPKIILLVLNDKIPDGRDVSWIWDVDFEPLVKKRVEIIVSGQRLEDMALRIKYDFNKGTMKHFNKVTMERDLKRAINLGLAKTREDETFYILPTYSAMLEVRKILLGRGIG